MSKIKVEVYCYNDMRFDPRPPNNWQAMVKIGGVSLIPLGGDWTHSCMTEKKARQMAEKIASALNVKVSKS